MVCERTMTYVRLVTIAALLKTENHDPSELLLVLIQGSDSRRDNVSLTIRRFLFVCRGVRSCVTDVRLLLTVVLQQTLQDQVLVDGDWSC